MTSLNRFLERITADGKPIGEYQAYKMDSTNQNLDMRKSVGLGTCHCCDYFLVRDDFIVFIEETRLFDRVRRIKEDYHYLKGQPQRDIINDRIRERMQLKAYGSMLVLCRLAEKCVTAKNLIQDKKFHFWVVVSNINLTKDETQFDYLKDSLRGKLKSLLGGKLLDDVNVLSPEMLKKKLSENETAP